MGVRRDGKNSKRVGRNAAHPVERAGAGAVVVGVSGKNGEQTREERTRRSELIMDTNVKQRELVRGTGLLIIEVVNSNPNGDPDNESEPRTRVGEKGEISPVSFKRKLRDLVELKEGPVWLEVAGGFEPPLSPEGFDILEQRGRDRQKVEGEIKDGSFVSRYWDGRLFGNTFLE